MRTSGKSNIIPGVRYRDAAAAIEFLCTAFGFEKRLVVPGDDGFVPHAQLTLGDGMIMLGTARDDEYGALISQPADVGGTTAAAYIVVDDIEPHYERAKAAGAEILIELTAQDYGGSAYTARDPEGHVWNFGSYDPWADD
jgi:uncharacterized glyoxalase superfamily protein PhnB